MHELSCPSCNAAAQYDLQDYLLMCPFCSVTFALDMQTGRKEVYHDHFIVPNSLDAGQIKSLVIRWLKRLHHSPGAVEREFFVVDIRGFSMPFWIISLEAHTAWSGLVRRHRRGAFDQGAGANYVSESGQFRRNYRWSISARRNICEYWGMTSMHEPKEKLTVGWDGFPLDSTYSRGRIDPNLGVKRRVAPTEEKELSAYDVREQFEFKFANGIPILSIQVPEDEAVHRAKSHVERYHYSLSEQNADVTIDAKTDVEIAGAQLVHLPFWHVNYVYRPRSLLRHIQRSNQKNIILEGYAGGVLKSELSMIHRDKLWINTIVASVAALLFLFVGSVAHSAFLLAGFFCAIVAAASAFVATTKAGNEGSSFFHDSSSETEAEESATA